MYPYYIYITGNSSFNNYFLFSYYASMYATDQATVCSNKPSIIDNMAEIFASSHSLFHLSCDVNQTLQRMDYPYLCKKIAQACKFALIFKNQNNPDSSQHYEQLLEAFTKLKKEYRVIDISEDDIVTNKRRSLSNRVKFSDMYKLYMQQIQGNSDLMCYKFIAIMMQDATLLNTIINHHGVEYITENPIEEQIACQLDWIDANMYSELKDVYNKLTGKIEQIEPQYMETKPYDWNDQGEDLKVYTGTGLEIANRYQSVVSFDDNDYVEIPGSAINRAHIHQSLDTIIDEETDANETDRLYFLTSDTQAYPIFYQTVTFAGSPFKEDCWYINTKYVRVK